MAESRIKDLKGMYLKGGGIFFLGGVMMLEVVKGN